MVGFTGNLHTRFLILSCMGMIRGELSHGRVFARKGGFDNVSTWTRMKAPWKWSHITQDDFDDKVALVLEHIPIHERLMVTRKLFDDTMME